MRLLITGGAGYVGSHVALAALDNGHKVTIFDNLSTGHKKNINDKAKFFLGSTTSLSDLHNLFKKESFDAVIHLSASKSATESMESPLKYAENNVIGSLNLIKSCIKYGVGIFIFSSSAAVYGKPKYNPIDETHPLSPSNYYGFTKLSIEKNLEWFSTLDKIKYASLRYFNAAGYDVNKRINGLEEDPQNLIPIVMETANGLRKEINVYGNNFNTDDGTGVRDYVHVSDLAKAHISSLEYIINNKKNLTINLGTGAGHSVLDIINKTREISKSAINYRFKKERLGDPDKIIASGQLAKRLIGWEAEYSDLETIISSTWDIYKFNKQSNGLL